MEFLENLNLDEDEGRKERGLFLSWVSSHEAFGIVPVDLHFTLIFGDISDEYPFLTVKQSSPSVNGVHGLS